MNETILLLGTNSGNRMDNLKQAIVFIGNGIGEILRQSSVYESEPWGFEAESAFLNQVLVASTGLSPGALLNKIHEIETRMGRIRTGPGYSSRSIDIDILFYNTDILDLPELQIPHTRLHERRFTLEPLVELVPHKIHPVFKKNMVELLGICKDALGVVRLS